MKTLTVPLSGGSYDIIIEQASLRLTGSRLRELLPCAQKLAIVTDSNVFPLYGDLLVSSLRAAGFTTAVSIISAGESSKNLSSLERLYADFSRLGLTRSDAVLALGGGMIGDLAGFASATYLRGIDFIQLPTTLLAQVDASVGGKTAIDLPSGKNLVGAFHQPRAVYIDTDCLTTLSDSVFADGMAEVIKYACICDSDFFAFLESCGTRSEIMKHIEKMLYTCCRHKAQMVMEDERDNASRMLLNFGHTFAHAYELAGNYENYTHGQAVAAGMCMAAELGEQQKITAAGVKDRIAGLLRQYGLPTAILCSAEDYRRAVSIDKKGRGEEISLILLTEIGKSELVKQNKALILEILAHNSNKA